MRQSMAGRASLLIFEFISFAPEARLTIDGSGIRMYAALRADCGRSGPLVTEGPGRTAAGLQASRNDV